MRRLVLLLLVCTAGLFAQLPRGAWWDGPLASDINLTMDQKRQIRLIVREYRDRLIDLRGAAQKADGDLEDAFNNEKLDAQRANELIDRLAAARGELTRTLSQMNLKLRLVLTREQWRELQNRRGGNRANPARPTDQE